MNEYLLKRIEHLSELSCDGQFPRDWEEADEILGALKLLIVEDPSENRYALWTALIELGFFEELESALRPIERLELGNCKDMALLLRAYGGHVFGPPPKHIEFLELEKVKFTNEILESSRNFLLAALTIVKPPEEKSENDYTQAEVWIEQSLHHHPSNYSSLCLLMQITKKTKKRDRMSALLHEAIAHRTRSLEQSLPMESEKWLIDPVAFFRSQLIQQTNFTGTETNYYLHNMKKMLAESSITR